MFLGDKNQILLEDVSKFYGDVLGCNRVSLRLPPGITSLVGPNGSGKTTVMNLLTNIRLNSCPQLVKKSSLTMAS